MGNKPLLSIVTPVFNEEESILLFYDQISKVLTKLPYNFEIIFIDDGSRDGSAAKITSLKAKNKPKSSISVRPLRLSRNFGKEIAVTAGLHASKGEAVIILDSDLQHPVEKIPEFINKWKAGADVIIGVRTESGHNSLIKNAGSKLFYKIINSISETEIIPHSTDFRLVDRHVLNEFNRFTERHRITRGLIDWLGFTRDTVMFEANERQFGAPSYTLKKLISLAVTSFISHSLMPLRAAGYLGVFLLVITSILGSFIIIEQFLMNDPLGLAVSGTAMITVAILFMCGVILTSLGMISMYLAIMHGEVINRPLYVLRRED